MLIEINTDALIRDKVTANQFILLWFLFDGKYHSFELFRKTYSLDEEMLSLIEKGFILAYTTGMKAEEIPIDRGKLHVLFNVKQSCFWELFGTYPIKVNNGRSLRILRPSSLTAKETLECLRKYELVLRGSRHSHEHIMRCLNAELWLRKKNGNLGYMQELATWINGRSWQKYEFLLEYSNQQKLGTYGEELI